MSTGIIIAVLVGLVIWWTIWGIVWTKGSKNNSNPMIIAGGLFCLGFLGLIIAAIQISSRNNNKSTLIEQERLQVEKERLELEKNKASK